MIELSFVFGLDMRTAQMDLRALSKRRPSHITSAIVAFYTLPIAGPFWTTIKVMVLRMLCLARTMSVALGNLNVMLGLYVHIASPLGPGSLNPLHRASNF